MEWSEVEPFGHLPNQGLQLDFRRALHTLTGYAKYIVTLIKITQRKVGRTYSHAIEIVDVWYENHALYHQPKRHPAESGDGHPSQIGTASERHWTQNTAQANQILHRIRAPRDSKCVP